MRRATALRAEHPSDVKLVAERSRPRRETVCSSSALVHWEPPLTAVLPYESSIGETTLRRLPLYANRFALVANCFACLYGRAVSHGRRVRFSRPRGLHWGIGPSTA
jgi:hypothetical protein